MKHNPSTDLIFKTNLFPLFLIKMHHFAGLDSIRDCIAFPKTQTAACPLTDAPTEVTEKQLRELHIRVRTPPPAN